MVAWLLVPVMLPGCVNQQLRFKTSLVDAQEAFLRRDYDGAYRAFQTTGYFTDAQSQYIVGFLLLGGLEMLAFPMDAPTRGIPDWYHSEIASVLTVDERERQAVLWLRRSARGGVPEAAAYLATIYGKGVGGQAKDAALADCFWKVDDLWRKKLIWKSELDQCRAMEIVKGYATEERESEDRPFPARGEARDSKELFR